MPSKPEPFANGGGLHLRSRLPTTTLLAFIALCLSIFLVALDTVLIPTALPYISASFHLPDSSYAWVGSAYLLANGASIPFWGKLSDIFGRKPVILSANAIFLAASLICALSVDAEMLIAGRVVQGLGGGGVVVMVHVCVSDLFDIRYVLSIGFCSDARTSSRQPWQDWRFDSPGMDSWITLTCPSDRSFYLGIVGAVWAVASALGPVLGGIFAEHLSWRGCFYLNRRSTTFSLVSLSSH
jgi:MFS family permease